jgi:hypothetical protein
MQLMNESSVLIKQGRLASMPPGTLLLEAGKDA